MCPVKIHHLDQWWQMNQSDLKSLPMPSVDRSQASSPVGNCFKNGTFPSSQFEMSFLLKEVKNRKFLPYVLIFRGTVKDSKSSGDMPLYPMQYPSVEQHNILSLFLSWQFLAEHAQSFPGIRQAPSPLVKHLIQEESQSVKDCDFYLTEQVSFSWV